MMTSPHRRSNNNKGGSPKKDFANSRQNECYPRTYTAVLQTYMTQRRSGATTTYLINVTKHAPYCSKCTVATITY
eukprot:5599486-Pyramimonas_sp.AAC.1